MRGTTTPTRARWADRIRLGVLALVALLVSHTAIYAAEFGTSDRFAQAMASGGHDGWWLPASASILAVGFVILAWTVGGLANLELRARTAGRHGDQVTPSFAGEVRSIWPRLLPLVTVLFLVQENVEQLAAHGRLPGFDPLIGAALPIALPILGLVTLALALAGALVRWRAAILRSRISSATHRPRRVAPAETFAGRWRTIGALAPHEWMADRLDAGRAPPLLLRP